MSGASFFTATSVRQSNDCTVTRSVMPVLRIMPTASCANVAGSGVSAPLVGVSLVSRLYRTALPLPSPKRSASVGICWPSAACCSGNCFAYALAGLIRPTSYRASSASVSVLIAGPLAASHAPPGPRVRSGLSDGSCDSTSTPSLVTARSVSIVVTPIASARWNAAIVFSGARPRAPRCPCRSNPIAGLAVAATISEPSTTNATRALIAPLRPARRARADGRAPRGSRRTPDSVRTTHRRCSRGL